MGDPIDGRADQYALACTAFHLLTGEPPFANSNPAVVIGSHLSSPPPRVANLRADLSPIDHTLVKAMAKEPYQRFDTCRAFAAALRQGGGRLTGPADDTQLATNIPAPIFGGTNLFGGTNHEEATRSGSDAASTSRRTALIVGGIAALLAVGVVAFLGARLGQPPSAPPTASPPQPSSAPQDTLPAEPPRTVTPTAPPVTVAQPSAPTITIAPISHTARANTAAR